MPSIPFLTQKTEIYDVHKAAWEREERRLYGGDPVLTELLRWKGEEDEFFTSRKDQASYITLPKLHAGTLTGHLSGETPMPNMGQLGNVRARDQIGQNPNFAELLWYNVGIGMDGQELLPWFDGVQERALATGFRWVLVEKPSLSTLRDIREMMGRKPDGPVTAQDVIDGFRPYPVEYSPLDVPLWQYTNGRLDFAVLKIPITPESLVDEGLNLTATIDGFYLLVRRGFKGLGEQFSQGGWWKYTQDFEEIETGQWTETNGQIPLFQFIGEPSPGTTDFPAIARSLTMELGQIAVSLMNRTSERNWNMMQAAKSVNWILGINAKEHAKVIQQHDLGSITIGVPPVTYDDGRVGIPQMYNSSQALLDASAFKIVIEGGLEEAREIMVKQITSTPDSSGRSKEAGFAEATSPLLKRLAATRQAAFNSLLYFASLRFGIQNPTANLEMPREFKLAPVVEEVDSMLSALKRSWLRSPTWEQFLLLKRGEDAGMLPDGRAERNKIQTELEESATVTEPMDVLADDAPDTPGRQAPKPTPVAA